MPNQRVEQVSRLLFRNIGHTHEPFTQGMVKRVRSKKISTESIDFKTAKSAKTSQAWRYQGGQILRASSTRINNNTYEDPKDPGQPRRKQESNFFITINPNKEPDDDHLPIATQAMEKTLEFLSKDTNLATYIKFGPKVIDTPPKAQDYRQDKYVDVVHSVEWKAAVETGDILRRLHTHIWLTVTHYSQVQINVQMLQHMSKEIYNSLLPPGQQFDYLRINQLPYVHVKLLPQSDWTNVMKQYIHKGMMS